MTSNWEEFELVQRLDVVKTLAKDKNVLHLGCTNYPYTNEAIESGMLLHDSLEKVAVKLTGFDLDQRGIDILEARGTGNLFRADLENLDEVPLDGTFDVIIAGEMIEHLTNPGRFLEGIKRFMNRDTELIITTINAYCALRFAIYGLRGKRGKNEPVHPDHVSYYSYRTLGLLLERHGMKRIKFLFYDLGAEHRPHNPWFYNAFNDLAVRFSPQLADGVIAICKLSDESHDA